MYFLVIQSLELCSFANELFTHEHESASGMVISLSFAPSLDYLLVGLQSQQVFGVVLLLSKDQDNRQGNQQNQSLQIPRDIGEREDTIKYLKWTTRPGEGIIIGSDSNNLRCVVYKGKHS